MDVESVTWPDIEYKKIKYRRGGNNMLISYAQNFEDVLLWRALKHIEKGFYIDVGAQHPIIDSVSRLFYEQGWRGLHVEATTTYADLLREARPDEITVQAALSDAVGQMVFYEIPDTGISTGDAEIAAQHEARGFPIITTQVPTLLLRDMFEKADGEIHWLKIDVEGMEQQVLSGWQDSPKMPWIVCIESTLPLTQSESFEDWEGMLTIRGYEFAYFDGLNRYYVSADHPELRTAFRNGANLFDGFSLSGTASSGFCNHIQETARQKIEAVQNHAESLQHERDALNQKIITDTATFQKIDAESKETIRHLQADLDALHTQGQNDKLVMAELSAERDTLNQKIVTDTATFQKTDAENKETIRHLQADLDALHTQSQNDTLIIAELSTERDTLNQKIITDTATFQKTDAESKETIRHLQADLDALHTESQNGKLVIAELSAERRKLNQKIITDTATFRKNRGEQEKALKHLSLQNHATAAENKKLTAQQLMLGQKIQELEFLNRDMHSKVEQLTAKIHYSEAQKANAAKDFQKLQEIFVWKLASPLFGEKRLLKLHSFFKMTDNGCPHEAAQNAPPLVGRHSPPDHEKPTNISDNNFLAIPQSMYILSHDVTPANSVSELVGHSDERFVICTYLTILRRHPDTHGMLYYLNRIRTGESKQRIIWELSHSPEGREANVNLPDLITHRSLPRRIASRLKRWLDKVTGRAELHRSIRIIENQNARHVNSFTPLLVQMLDANTENKLNIENTKRILSRQIIDLQSDIRNQTDDIIKSIKRDGEIIITDEDDKQIEMLPKKASYVYSTIKKYIHNNL